MLARGRRPRKTNYLILWSRSDRLSPGDFVRSVDVGEIAFFKTLVPDKGLPREELVAVGLRVARSRLSAVIRMLIKYYADAEVIAKLAGIGQEQVRYAIVSALKNIARYLSTREDRHQ